VGTNLTTGNLQTIKNLVRADISARAGNLTRKNIATPIISHEPDTRTIDVSTVPSAEMNMYIYQPMNNTGTVSYSSSGYLRDANYRIKLRTESTKYLDVSNIQLQGNSLVQNATLQSHATKTEGGFTATFVVNDGTYDFTIEIDASPDMDYDNSVQMLYQWTLTNNIQISGIYLEVYNITGIVVLPHTYTMTGTQVHFDFGSEVFGPSDDFEFEAYVSTVDMGIEEDGTNTINGRITGYRRSMQTEVIFHAEGWEIGVFSMIPPLVISTSWNGNIATLHFFDPNVQGTEIWDLVNNVADKMVITNAIKNGVEVTT